MKTIFLLNLMMILTTAISTFSQTDDRKWFSLELLPENIKFTHLSKPDLKKLRPAGKPLIKQEEILFYNRDKHELTVYPEVIEKIFKLKSQINQRPFAVFIGDEAIYAGTFRSSLSSRSFDGIVINLDELQKDSAALRLELGYPTSNYFKGNDPRSDKRILQALSQVKKLYEDLELTGKCREIKPTYKHLPSSVFTFVITKIIKGKFKGKEISFELGYFSRQNSSRKLMDDIRNGELLPDSENYRDFDPEKEVVLRFIQPVAGENLYPRLINWEIRKK